MSGAEKIVVVGIANEGDPSCSNGYQPVADRPLEAGDSICCDAPDSGGAAGEAVMPERRVIVRREGGD